MWFVQSIALVQAAKNGELEEVSSQLRNGADVNFTDRVSSSTYLHQIYIIADKSNCNVRMDGQLYWELQVRDIQMWRCD